MELVKFGKLKEQSYTMKESLRALKTNIQFCGDDIRTLLVTSSVPNEGKSTVALDLARSLTESGNRVLFIDTDMCLQGVCVPQRQVEGRYADCRTIFPVRDVLRK